MKKPETLLPLFLLLFAFFAAGCFGVDKDFKKVRNGVFKSLSAEDVDKEIEYSASSFEVYILQKLASISDKTIEIELMLSKISNVQIGVYNLQSRNDDPPASISRIDKFFADKGWSSLIKSKSNNNCVLVYLNLESPDSINELFIVNAEEDEIVILRLEGKLNKLAELLIKNRGLSKKLTAAR